MVMAEEYEALQEEQKSMYHQMEELLAFQEGIFSPDKVCFDRGHKYWCAYKS